MDNEIKDIPGYEGIYSVTKDGKVWNSIRNKWVRSYVLKTRGQYSQVALSKDGKQKIHYVHRLIGLTWIPNPNNYPFVCHKVETIPATNTVENLWWGTAKMNVQDAIQKGRTRRNKGSYWRLDFNPSKHLGKQQLSIFDNEVKVLNKHTVELIRSLISYHGMFTDVASLFNVTKEAIRQIYNNKSHCGKKYK